MFARTITVRKAWWQIRRQAFACTADFFGRESRVSRNSGYSLLHKWLKAYFLSPPFLCSSCLASCNSLRALAPIDFKRLHYAHFRLGYREENRENESNGYKKGIQNDTIIKGSPNWLHNHLNGLHVYGRAERNSAGTACQKNGRLLGKHWGLQAHVRHRLTTTAAQC